MSIPPKYFPESFKEEVFVDCIKKPVHPKNFHFHRNHCEICLVTSGKFCYVFDDQRYELNPFDMVFIPNPVEHKIVSFESDTKSVCYVLNFDSSLFSQTNTEQVLLYDIFNVKKLTVPTQDIHSIYSAFTSLAIESDYPAPFSKDVLKNLVYNLLVVLYRLTHNLSTQYQLPTKSIIESATKFIAANYRNDICVADIAKFCNTDSAYLSRIFKKVIGMTIVKYLTSIRIHQACTFLLESEKSITEISELCGFSSVKRFCEVFKAQKGISAREFRKNKN